MNYQMSGAQLEAAVATITEAMTRSMYFEEPPVPKETDPEDLMFYDAASMCKHLQVTERTLHRYRKDGKIKFTVVGGRIYYPKNFLPGAAQNTEVPSIPL